MKLSHKTFSLLAITSTATFSFSTTTFASSLSTTKTITQTLDFKTSNQSMWSSGSGNSFSNTTTLGTSWDKSGGIDPVTLVDSKCFLGICTPSVKTPSVSGSTSGNISLTNTFTATSGTVNADIPIDLTLSLPSSITSGQIFSIDTGYTLNSKANFETFSPGISENLDLNFKAAANLNISGITNPKFNVDKTFNLLQIDNHIVSKDIINNNLGSLTVTVPQVNTKGTINKGSNSLSSSGSDTFANGTLNITNIAARLADLPPLSGGDSFGVGPLKVGYNYNLLTVDGTLNLNATQSFGLNIQNLPATLSLLDNSGKAISSYKFKLGDTISGILAPTNWSGNFQESVDINALLSNNTGIQFEPGFSVSALGAGITYPGGSKNLGPLFSASTSFPITPISVYNKTFALGGFGTQVANFSTGFSVQNTSTAVPEPSNILGALLGGYGVTRLFKKRKKST